MNRKRCVRCLALESFPYVGYAVVQMFLSLLRGYFNVRVIKKRAFVYGKAFKAHSEKSRRLKLFILKIPKRTTVRHSKFIWTTVSSNERRDE